MSANIRPSGVFDTSYAEDISLNRTRFDRILANGLFIILLAMPLFAAIGIIPIGWIGTINGIAITAIAVQGLNILVGFTGQISLGHAAFLAVGAYSGAIFARGFDVTLGGSVIAIPALPFFIVIPLAALVTGLVGLLFGLPSLRVKGFYLAMATLAAQFIIPWILKNPLEPLTNGTRALEVPTPSLLGLELSSASEVFYLIIPLSVFMMLAARNISRTRTGRAFISIRDNDLAAELLGINVFVYKLQAFFLSALYAGVAGALIAYETNNIQIDPYNLDYSIRLLAMLIIGGAGFPLGAVFGAGFVVILIERVIPALIEPLKEILPTIITFVEPVNIEAALSPFLFGLALIVFLILEPRGIAHRWEILKYSWKIRPYSY